MGKQAKYKYITKTLRAELDRLFDSKQINLTTEQKEHALQTARKKAIKELSFKKKSV
jgi:hypothetical protein